MVAEKIQLMKPHVLEEFKKIQEQARGLSLGYFVILSLLKTERRLIGCLVD